MATPTTPTATANSSTTLRQIQKRDTSTPGSQDHTEKEERAKRKPRRVMQWMRTSLRRKPRKLAPQAENPTICSKRIIQQHPSCWVLITPSWELLPLKRRNLPGGPSMPLYQKLHN